MLSETLGMVRLRVKVFSIFTGLFLGDEDCWHRRNPPIPPPAALLGLALGFAPQPVTAIFVLWWSTAPFWAVIVVGISRGALVRREAVGDLVKNGENSRRPRYGLAVTHGSPALLTTAASGI
jgi:hypothetical protein